MTVPTVTTLLGALASTPAAGGGCSPAGSGSTGPGFASLVDLLMTQQSSAQQAPAQQAPAQQTPGGGDVPPATPDAGEGGPDPRALACDTTEPAALATTGVTASTTAGPVAPSPVSTGAHQADPTDGTDPTDGADPADGTAQQGGGARDASASAALAGAVDPTAASGASPRTAATATATPSPQPTADPTLGQAPGHTGRLSGTAVTDAATDAATDGPGTGFRPHPRAACTATPGAPGADAAGTAAGAQDAPAGRGGTTAEQSTGPGGLTVTGSGLAEATAAAPGTATATATVPATVTATGGMLPGAPRADSAAGGPGGPGGTVTAQVVPEVARMVTRGDGTQRLTLRLSPESLGDVRIVVTVRAGTVDVSLAAGPQAQEALRHGSPELRRLLESVGATQTQVVVRDLPASTSSPQHGATSAHADAAGADAGRQHSGQDREPGGHARDAGPRPGTRTATAAAAAHRPTNPMPAAAGVDLRM